MIVAKLRNNRVYKAMKEIYEMELTHAERQAQIEQTMQELQLDPMDKELRDYNFEFGCKLSYDERDNRVLEVKHPNGDYVRLVRYAGRTQDELGEITISSKRAKHRIEKNLITYANYRVKMKLLVEETLVSPTEKLFLYEHFLSLAYDPLEELVYLTYESELIDPQERRSLFNHLAYRLNALGCLGEADAEMLEEYQAEMLPKEESISGYLQMFMTLPNGYEIVMADYGTPKEQLGPKDSILVLGIRYCNPRFPAVFDRDTTLYFSLEEVGKLRALLRNENQLDEVGEYHFKEFIDKVVSRYR